MTEVIFLSLIIHWLFLYPLRNS